MIISFFLVAFARSFMYLGDTPLWFNLFIGGFAMFCANWVRETIVESEEVPFSWTDVNMGTYAGILGAYLSILVF